MAKSDSTARRKPKFRERKAGVTVPVQPRAATFPAPHQPLVRAAPRLDAGARAISIPQITVEQGLYATLLLLGFVVRIWDLGSRAMHGDESVHAWMAWNLYSGNGYQYDPVYHGPFQFIVTTALFFLFGVSNTTGRLLAVLFGTGLIVLPFFLRRWMGRVSALLAAAFLTVSPAFVYVSRLERDDIFSAFFALTLAIAIFSYVATRRVRYVYLGAASAALSLSALENTYITLFVFVTYLAIVLTSEYLSRHPVGVRIIRLWRASGRHDLVRTQVLLGLGGVLLVSFLLTVTTGFYLPLLLILAMTIVLLVHRQVMMTNDIEVETVHLDALRSISRQQWLNAITIIVAIFFLLFSTFGSNLRGIWDASQPFLNTGHACPGNPYFLNPCRKDIIGGLFYWLSQHAVHRGGQPWFYYTFLFGLYEQIALIFGTAGIVWFMRRPSLFTSFLIYWAVLTFGIYSWAGEKFSWIMIHPLLPFTLLASMFIADVIRRATRWRRIVLTLAGLLTLLQIHSLYEVNFVYGADPVEMMVYVQSSPDTPKVADKILSISHKLTGGNTLKVTIDTEETWPFAWYLRGMPNAAYPGYPQLLQNPYPTNPIILVDDQHQPQMYPKIAKSYTGQRYRLRWWFPEDYKALTWPTFFADAVNPGYWSVVGQWLLDRRPFGPRQAVWFYFYVKNGLVSPY